MADGRVLKMLLAAAPALALCGCLSAGRRAGGPPAPREFSGLYSELDSRLAAAERTAASLPGPEGPCPVSAPALFIASSYFASSAPGTKGWENILAMMSAFRRLGAGAVSVMISFPDLTPQARDPEPVLRFYEAVSAEAHKRGLKLLVEHFVYPPSAPTPSGRLAASLKTLPDPRAAYLAMKRREAELIISRVKPDYFSVITEPSTYERFLGFAVTPEDYAAWLSGLLASPAAAARGAMKIGAGAGVWEDRRYAAAFARVKGLDYIDLHFYPLRLGSEDYVSGLLDIISGVRAADPRKGIVISETWLYKHGAGEPGGVFSAKAYGRNGYAFWAPLDERFLALMERLGRKEGIELIAPYFPQFFFYSVPYEEGKAPQWPASMGAEWEQAAARAGSTTALGGFFAGLNAGCRAGAPAAEKRAP